MAAAFSQTSWNVDSRADTYRLSKEHCNGTVRKRGYASRTKAEILGAVYGLATALCIGSDNSMGLATDIAINAAGFTAPNTGPRLGNGQSKIRKWIYILQVLDKYSSLCCWSPDGIGDPTDYCVV